MSGIIDVGVLAFSVDEIVDASNQPLISAMLIAFVISESRSKLNIVLAESMVCCHVVLEVRMLFDLSIIPGKFEFPIRLDLLAQETKEPIVMEPDQVISLHLQTHKVFKLFDAMVHIRDLIVFIHDLDNLASF